ncbi:MAG: mitofilin family membrane protein [Alphaproteobacteria bacterium]|nr:mitofilin family membrane protein [Alphaproteobacteria bacterium]
MPLLASVLAVIIAVTTPVWGPLVWGGDGKSSAVAKLEADQKALIGSVAELSATVTQLSEGQVTLNTSIRAVKVPAILIVADDLREEINSGGPFADKLNLFRAIVGENDPAMESVYALDPWAEIGIPTDQDLQRTFDEVSQDVVAASQIIESGGGEIARTISETMASLTAATIRLRWRLDGVPDGDGPLSIMARAEEMVRAGAFDMAIAELEALPEAMKAKTESWIAAVQSRDLAAEAVADLDVYMIEAVARAQ